MKTLKSMIAFILIASTTVLFAQNYSPSHIDPGPAPAPQSITTQLSVALQSVGLVSAMKTQLDPSFLQEHKSFYTVMVKYGKQGVYVTGSAAEWKAFFGIHPGNDEMLKKVNRIPLKKAIGDPALNRAMHKQLSPSLLLDNKPVYTVKVKYNQSIVYVFGNYTDWRWFFRTDIQSDPLQS